MEKQFDITVLGGTFDRLHKGHEYLLRCAVEVTKKKILIGVTTEELHAKKVHKTMIESYDIRGQNIKKFIKTLDDKLEIQIIPISDPYGPAVTIQDIDAIIGTRETAENCYKINDIRKLNNLHPCEVIILDLIYENSVKISSTDIRNKELNVYFD